MPVQLYSLDTPNGHKVAVALEELGLEYVPHTVNILKGDQFKPEFLALNPNGKIPAIVDEEGIDGKPITVFESGAILIYLADKTGKLLPKDPAERYETLAWLMWQMGGLGPMLGQFGHFTRFANEKVPYAIERYTTEAKRLLRVLDERLQKKGPYIMGEEYTIADIAAWPWVNGVRSNEALGVGELKAVPAWLDLIGKRPAVQKGITVTPF